MACIDNTRNTHTSNDARQYSSRKLWELLQGSSIGDANHGFAWQARQELIARGDFHPNRAWSAPS